MLVQISLPKFTSIHYLLPKLTSIYRAGKQIFLQDLTLIYPIQRPVTYQENFTKKGKLSKIGRFINQNVQNQILRNFQNKSWCPKPS